MAGFQRGVALFFLFLEFAWHDVESKSCPALKFSRDCRSRYTFFRNLYESSNFPRRSGRDLLVDYLFDTPEGVPANDEVDATIQPNVLTPLCLVAPPAAGVSVRFGRPKSHTFGTDMIALSTLEPVNDSTALVTVFPRTSDRRYPYQFLATEESLVRSKPFLPKRTVDLPENFVLLNHTEHSGDFVYFPHLKRRIGLIHSAGYFVKVVVQRSETDYCDIPTTGFHEVGGENIGSIFVFQGTLYAAVRTLIPYNLNSIEGHGFRQGGLYRIRTNCTDAEPCDCWASGDLIHRIENKSQMCRGSCTAKKVTRESIEQLDLRSVAECEKRALAHFERKELANGVSTAEALWQFSILSSVGNPFHRCIKKALFDEKSNNLLDILECLNCRHRHRQAHQIYHTAVSALNGKLVGLLSTKDANNLVQLCHIDDSLRSLRCFHSPLFRSANAPGHPIQSKLTTLQNIIVSLTPSRRGGAGTFFSWRKEAFCTFRIHANSGSVETLWLNGTGVKRSGILYHGTSLACPPLNVTIHIPGGGPAISVDPRVHKHGDLCICTIDFEASYSRFKLLLRAEETIDVGNIWHGSLSERTLARAMQALRSATQSKGFWASDKINLPIQSRSLPQHLSVYRRRGAAARKWRVVHARVSRAKAAARAARASRATRARVRPFRRQHSF